MTERQTAAPRAPSLRLMIAVPCRPFTIAAPRAAGVRLTIVVPRRPRTIVRRGLLMITEPRAPRRPLTTVVPRRLTTAVPRRPFRIVAPRVRFTTAVPRGPLTIDVSRTTAFALGTSIAMIPRNAVTPRAASTDKRIVASLVWVEGEQAAFEEPCLASRCGDFRPGTLCAFIASFSETFLDSLLFSGIPECFVAGRTPNEFAKSNRVPIGHVFAKLRLKRHPRRCYCCLSVHLQRIRVDLIHLVVMRGH